MVDFMKTLALVLSLFVFTLGCKGEKSTPLLASTIIPTNQSCTQANFYVDPQGTFPGDTASDSNNCSSTSTACKTYGQVISRLIGCNLSQTTTIFGLTNGQSTDPVYVPNTIGIMGGGNLAIVAGSTTTIGNGATALASGTITAVTALNRTANQITQITDSTANFTTGCGGGSCVKYSGRILTGAHPGAVFTIVKVVSGTQINVSVPVIPAAVNTISGGTSSSVSIGDTYQIDQQIKLYAGQFAPENIPSGATSTFTLQDFEIQNVSGYTFTFDSSANQSTFVARRNRILGGNATFVRGTFALFNNSIVNAQTICQAGAKFISEGNGYTSGVRVQAGCAAGMGLVIDDTIEGGTGLTIEGGTASIQLLGVFDATVSGSTNPRGSGVQVGAAPANQTYAGLAAKMTGTLYGSGNAGAGVDIISGYMTHPTSAIFTITGSDAGTFDFILGGSPSNIVTISAQPSTYSAAITPSWANFADAGSFNGNAQELMHGTRLVVEQ